MDITRSAAAAAYRRDDPGVLRAFGIAVLDVTATGIARIVVFGEPGPVTTTDVSARPHMLRQRAREPRNKCSFAK
jgi:hypothetical protein